MFLLGCSSIITVVNLTKPRALVLRGSESFKSLLSQFGVCATEPVTAQQEPQNQKGESDAHPSDGLDGLLQEVRDFLLLDLMARDVGVWFGIHKPPLRVSSSL